MFCPKCGSQVPDGTKFCPKCGSALGGAPAAAPAGVTAAVATPRPTSKGVIIGLAVMAVAIVAALVFFLVSCMGGGGYEGTWRGTREVDGKEAELVLTLNGDKSAELELSYDGMSQGADLEWRETDDGVEVTPEGEESWQEFEKDGDALKIELSGEEFELTK